MRPYQEEYKNNIETIMALKSASVEQDEPFESWYARCSANIVKVRELKRRNMELLRDGLLPTIDNIFETLPADREDLREFAGSLMKEPRYIDIDMYCIVHRALLSYYRLSGDRDELIQELYCLGLGLHNRNNMLVAIPLEYRKSCMNLARMYFAEAAAFIKYFGQLKSEQTQAYVIRSMANTSLGYLGKHHEKIVAIHRMLQVLNDNGYRSMAPGLPWDSYVRSVHLQMVAARSIGSVSDMTPEDMAYIMESCHIIYDTQIEEARREGRKPSARWLANSYEMEYLSGLASLNDTLGKFEILMESADIGDYSISGAYEVVSLHFIYQGFVLNSGDKDLLWRKRKYLSKLNKASVDYVCRSPEDKRTQAFYHYMYQVLHQYLETDDGESYASVAERLLAVYTPDEYISAWTVGKAAGALSRRLLDSDPLFFCDIPELADVTGGELSAKASELAEKSGLLRNLGMLYFAPMDAYYGRDYSGEAYELLKLHTVAGHEDLSARDSTRAYADVALGHHTWYDGSDGFPESFCRRESPYRQLVDTVALADFLEELTNPADVPTRGSMPLEMSIESALKLEGSRFSPVLTEQLRDEAMVREIEEIFSTAPREAARRVYEYKRQ